MNSLKIRDIEKNKKLIESIRKNHQTLYLLSEKELIELHKNATKDKPASTSRVVAGNISAALDGRVLIQMIRDLGFTGRVYEKYIRGEKYIIFKGKLEFKTIFTKTAKNARVVDMAIGKTSAIVQSARSGARLTIFFTVPIIILQHFLEDEVLLSNLLADLAVSLIKVGVSSIAAAVAAVAVGTTTTIAAAPLAVALFIGLAIAYSLDKLDEYFSITEKLGLILREIEDATIGEISRKGWELEKILRWQIANDITPGKGIFYP
ncbi:hypothetical protein QL989_18965 [Pseudoalteromonas sp. APC 3224]|jgi:hypothetical protein|uniref:hypothetical protein n=1 Tax=Pseudoalteromonas sp. APC 3224 TaxID=3035203 RepID=UPI0025B509B7|nr:hypothetical protein [Pseudoalteromonas sp. APC 3224]MDN3487424.1 hypothetical protein [Pseudoalteromonas sp. APC 3224]|tara:strand:+ start:115 stop:903 length:789 start_codon:yes stop_codon:yes gene_type:complete